MLRSRSLTGPSRSAMCRRWRIRKGLHGPAGSVASTSTIWRVLAGIDEAMLGRIRHARAEARDRAWTARGERSGSELRVSRAAGRTIPEVVIDLDATLVTAHSDKEDARGNFKGGFGHHPLGAWLDNSNEALAMVLRPGKVDSSVRRNDEASWCHREALGRGAPAEGLPWAVVELGLDDGEVVGAVDP